MVWKAFASGGSRLSEHSVASARHLHPKIESFCPNYVLDHLERRHHADPCSFITYHSFALVQTHSSSIPSPSTHQPHKLSPSTFPP